MSHRRRQRHGIPNPATGRALVLAAVVLSMIALAWAAIRLLGALEASDPAERWTEILGDRAPSSLNVILVTIDTLRADHLSCYGATQVSTPAIDRLAAEGVRFSNVASTVPFTLPSHSSIMTGTYPPFHGVRENVGYALDESLPTLAERLGEGGWTTGGFVSAFVLDSRWGIARGFETYYDDFELDGDDSHNLGAVQRPGAETLSESLRWLDTSTGRSPFFLWLHIFEPHDPYTPPEPFKSRYAGRPYEGEVAHADSIIGDLRTALEERGLLDSSLLVLTADHGEALGQHGEGFHGFFVYDSTVRVPLIVRLPGGGLRGRVVDDAVSHVDLMPTILEATAQPSSEPVQGRSLLPLLMGLGPDDPATAARETYSESLYPLLHYGWAPLRTLRTARYKLIDAPRPELYDLAEDPREERNIFRRDRQLARELEARLDDLRTRIERTSESDRTAPEIDPATLEQLRALGYVGGFGGAGEDEEGNLERADPKDRIQLHQMVMAAQSELGRGELDQAETRLRQTLEVDPSVVDAHQMLGAIEMRRGRPELAASAFQAALDLRGDHPAALFGLADAYRQLGRFEDALLGYDRILADDPDHGGALVASANALAELGRLEQATTRLEQAAAATDAGPMVLNRLGELQGIQGRIEDAAAAFTRAIESDRERDDQFAQPRFNLAVIREEAGRVDEAIELYEAAIERGPRHYQALFNLGRLMGARGDIDRQQALYERAIEAEPTFVRGYYFLGKLLMDRDGDLARAEEIVRAGLERDEDHRAGPLGYYLLADILNRSGRTAEAQRAVDRGRQIERGS